MGESNVAKPRKFLPLALALVTMVAVGAPTAPLLMGLDFRDGTGMNSKVRRQGTATITSCDTTYYGLVYKCSATVRWSEGYESSPPPVAETVLSSEELRGEVKVQRRVEERSRRRDVVHVVPAGHPFGTTAGGFLLPLWLLLITVPTGIVLWQGYKRLRKPLPETPPESTELRAAQVSRDKARRRRRKTNR